MRSDMNHAMLLAKLKTHFKLNKNQTLVVLYKTSGGGLMAPVPTSTIGELDSVNRSPDGALYAVCSVENVFG